MNGISLDRAYSDLFSPDEATLVGRFLDDPIPLRARQRFVRARETLTHSAYLVDGFVGRYRSDWTGRRQFLALQIPGDFIDLPSYMLGRLDHDLDSFTAATICRMPHEKFTALRQAAPDTYDKLWRISLIDAAIHRYWAFRVGRLVGRARIANLFAEIFVRQFSRGLCDQDRFPLLITQNDLAEACGMTPVHANRMLGELRAEGICSLINREVVLHDFPAMVKTGQFEWDYLFLPPDIEAEVQRLCGRSTAPARRSQAICRML